ncbi:MAG: hypothetical protein ACFFAO_03825 [Candidatus Hermodarchaeota archaeon]
MDLDFIDFLNGTFSLIIVIIFTILGLKIVLRYFKVKNRQVLYAGIFWTGLAEPWYGSAFSFLCYLITGQGLPPEPYMLIANIGIPFLISTWITAVTDLVYQKHHKIIRIIFAIYGIIFEIYLFYFIITDISMIGELQGVVDVAWVGFVRIYLISLIVILAITGTLFSKELLRSENPENRFKGKLILIAFWAYCIGGVLDTGLPVNPLTLILSRTIVISSSIFFYLGFLLPQFIRNRLFPE